MEINLPEKLCQDIRQLEMERIAYADLILKAISEKQVDNETIEELKKEYLDKYYQLDEIKLNIKEVYNLNTDNWYLDLQNNILNVIIEDEKEEK